MAYVTTDGGDYVTGKADPKAAKPAMTIGQAQSDAADRNWRAEALGIQTRYVVVDED